jgi:hypothetical protein
MAAAVAVCFATRSLKTDFVPAAAGTDPPRAAGGVVPPAIGFRRLRLVLIAQN